MKFPVSEPGSHPILQTFFVDFRCRLFDGVYPAVDSSTPLRVTVAGLSITAAGLRMTVAELNVTGSQNHFKTNTLANQLKIKDKTTKTKVQSAVLSLSKGQK
ncbi:MAG: hypothetical protein A2W93_11575 [Bacteroidetes bacterium GWF2_43_63]|nr:MAG: hypothetical protein A2W94_14450 [Bacteroidetes bacterium GWE2_42_42]OFY54909.1 MAG: hypothetical protein A2W93_11575 [Bacteroidetes bacterium GWF2_43_63]HCB63182.1 hypothetical protein [Bacteroidales bacterium]HCY22213.1 hypothetical protein [Bacteroidales bacterium]